MSKKKEIEICVKNQDGKELSITKDIFGYIRLSGIDMNVDVNTYHKENG